MNNTERKIKSVLENNYDHVLKTHSNKLTREKSMYFTSGIKANLSKIAGYEEVKSLNHFFRSGSPDFLAFNSNYDNLDFPDEVDRLEINDLKFVEVKKRQDSLRTSQLDWFKDFNDLSAEIWVVSKKEQHRLGKYRPDDFYSKFLPKEIVNIMNWSAGDELEIDIVNENKVIIEKPEAEKD